MVRPAFELASIFRQHGAAYRRHHALTRQQLRVMRAVEVCRTAVLGGHAEECGQCQHRRIAYNSCRNRHCPKCQNAQRAKWLQQRKAELLPVEYFHVVFTLPEPIARLALQNKTVVYSILFQTVSETLLTLAKDPKHLGAEIGFFAILHTWGQNLLHHPHVHCVVPGGGLSRQRDRWIGCRPGFFLPVGVLSRFFRRLFLQRLRSAFQQGELEFHGELQPLQARSAFHAFLAPWQTAEWVVYAKPPFGGAQQALEYLGRYTHRVALSNERLLAVSPQRVMFQWKDYRRRDKQKSQVLTLAVDEFIRRFLLHTLPEGFQRIRHFGLLANRHRQHKLALCRRLLTAAGGELLPASEQCQALRQALLHRSDPVCPKCGMGRMIRVGWIAAYLWPSRPPDSS